MRRAVAVVIAGVAFVSAAPASTQARPIARAAGVRDCHTWAYYPNVLISSVRNMGCKRAARDMRRYNSSIKRRFTTPGGFRCVRVSGTSLGGQWRCARHSKAYRFEFGD